jgi:hypothetical protein
MWTYFCDFDFFVHFVILYIFYSKRGPWDADFATKTGGCEDFLFVHFVKQLI